MDGDADHYTYAVGNIDGNHVIYDDGVADGDLYCDADIHAYHHTDADPYQHRDDHLHSDLDLDAVLFSDTDVHKHPDLYVHDHRDAHTHPVQHADLVGDAHSHRVLHPYLHRHLYLLQHDHLHAYLDLFHDLNAYLHPSTFYLDANPIGDSVPDEVCDGVVDAGGGLRDP